MEGKEYKEIPWKPGTINRVERNRFIFNTILREGYIYKKGERIMSAFLEPFSLDIADLDGIVQSVNGYAEELFEMDPKADSSIYGKGYNGIFLLFNDKLNKRIRSEEFLSDNDIEEIMAMIQPDRTKPFRRRIRSHLFKKNENSRPYGTIWPEVKDYLRNKGIDSTSYFIATFLSAAIGIYQLEKVNEITQSQSINNDLIYYKPGADFCGVEHYYGIRAVGIEDGVIKPLNIPVSNMVHPKDVWKYVDVDKVKEDKRHLIKDVANIIYSKEILSLFNAIFKGDLI